MNAPWPFVSEVRLAVDEGAHWFFVRKRELLMAEGWELPARAALERAGIVPLRTQALGRLHGVACFSAELPSDFEPPEGLLFHDLRQLIGRLPEPLWSVAARAIQIVDWDRTHQFCGACATPTELHGTRRVRTCPRCKIEFYPRVAPAMIVAVERGPEILLARSPHFPPGIYSVLAGFVDPGESAEEAVEREVLEEVGVRVRDVRYFGSQPWPFPHSLMLGFRAEYLSGEIVRDESEIEDARFFHVNELPKTFPGRVSISQWLLQDFVTRMRR
jgi:NAD+ diphosphatase